MEYETSLVILMGFLYSLQSSTDSVDMESSILDKVNSVDYELMVKEEVERSMLEKMKSWMLEEMDSSVLNEVSLDNHEVTSEEHEISSVNLLSKEFRDGDGWVNVLGFLGNGLVNLEKENVEKKLNKNIRRFNV